MRELVFKEGGSNKFWKISLDGKSFEVHYGRVGTAGQKQTKTFPTPAAALKAHDGLVAEKLKKGYVDDGAPKKASAATAPKPEGAKKPKAETKVVAKATDTGAIDLTDSDWRWATWRSLPPLPPGAPAPFVPESCLARLAKAKVAQRTYDLSKAAIPLFMSAEEARLWFEAMVDVDPGVSAPDVAGKLAKKKLAPLDAGKVAKRLRGECVYPGIELGWMLGALLSPIEVARQVLVAGALPKTLGHRGPGDPFYGLRETALLRLTDAEKAALRKEIAADITPANFPTDPYHVPSGKFLLAPLLGMHAELEAVVASWDDDRYGKTDWDDAYQVPQHIILGLGSAERVAHHMQRLRLKLRQPEYMRGWFAHTEVSGVDYAAETVIATKNKVEAAKLAALVALVHAPEAAGAMQAIVKKSKAPQIGAAWLKEHAQGAPLPKATAPAAGATAAVGADDALLAALAKSSFNAPDPLVLATKKKGDAAALDRFAWSLFQGWLVDGAPPKAKWKLVAVGLLGGDQAALELAPLVRAWPGESQHQRAVLGLECLRAIGTDVALMQLSGIALKVKFQALKAKAAECMDAIAASRGMSRDELEDRIVPDGGLGPDGKRVLSFGARSFDVVLGPAGAPMVREQASGSAAKPDLPKPGAKDDAQKAKAASEEWKLLKKTLRETTKTQIARLEQAMVTARTWSAADFETLLLRHPLLGQLIRSLVWGVVDAKGKLGVTFRIAEDRTLASAGDKPFTLAKSASVRVCHPLELNAKQSAAWTTLFGDYEIIAPFQQLGRQTFTLDPKEAKGDDLAPRFKGVKVATRAFINGLRAAGWVHGAPEDAGLVYEHTKVFRGAGVVAIVTHSGYAIGDPDWGDPQTIEHVGFVAGEQRDAKKRLKLGAVDPVALSEVLLDLTSVAS
jgi:predicted DNA-binding WGR domain protein